MRTLQIALPLFSFHGLILSLLAAPAMAGDTTNDPAVEEVIVQGRQSDYSVITENAQKIIDVPGALGDPLMLSLIHI